MTQAMNDVLPEYAELHCLSNFTFLRGASHPEELVQKAFELGYRSLALTDECSLAGVVRAHVEAKRCRLHFIIGSEITLSCGLKLVLLALDRDGYGNLSELITLGRRRAVKGSYELHRSDMEEAEARRHLQGMPGCFALFLPDHRVTDDTLAEQATWIAATFPGRAAIGVALLHRIDHGWWLERLRMLSALSGLNLTATGDVHMHRRSRKALQDVLTSIRLRKPLAECGLQLQPNAEQYLRPRVRLANIYPPDLLQETLAIARRCTFSLNEIRYQYPDEIVPPGESLHGYLRRLVDEGIERRFPQGASEAVKLQIEKELALISEKAYEPYFLTVYDIVRFARSENILCQGRGSAANSAVCYCLGITEVDPSRMQMLFERFISRERDEPPDIDVDFEHERREEVMQYIYEKYGRHRAALAAALITYRPRSALKDVGKALGMDADSLHRLSRSHQWWDGRHIDPRRVEEAGFDPDSRIVTKLIELSAALIGFPRHLSQHSGGFVIARGSLARLVPIENAAMNDRNVIQWDKDDLDAMGLLKIDVLALGMLSAIRRALEFISLRRGCPFRMQDIPAEDAATYEMISQADTIGVFQIESRAQMSMLPRLRPEKFYDLVIQVAIVRPGPIQGGMVHPYLRRRQGLEKVIYPGNDPELIRVLERTEGVPLFQEQAMQIAMIAAGFSPGEADQLRRAMAAWRRRGEMEEFRARLIEGMKAKDYDEKFARSIFEMIEGFGEYGFPESHAASFAILVYVSAWIKRHEPAAFLAALLNAQPLGFYSPSQLVQDARRHQVEVKPPDVMCSDWDCTLEGEGGLSQGMPCAAVAGETCKPHRVETMDHRRRQPAVRLGLRMVSGLSSAGAARLIEARTAAAFHDVEDLARRAELGTHDLNSLAQANALASLAGHRRQAAWQVAAIGPLPPMFKEVPAAEAALELPPAPEGREILADYRSMGLTLNRHPLALLRARLKAMNLSSADEMRSFGHGKLARTAGIVTMRQRPQTAKGTIFVTLEDETGSTNVIIWPSLLERQRAEVLNARLMTVYGIWQREGQVMHLVAKRIVDHSVLLGSLAVSSREFH
jgi:error-prone DNA polymerase